MLEMAYGFMLARRALMLAGVLFAGCCALWAQSEPQSNPPAGGPGVYHHGGERGPEHELRELTHVLTLSSEQQTQVKTLLTERQQQMDQMRSQQSNGASGETAQPNREKFQAIRQDTDTKINALLSDDQKTKFAAWQQQRKQRMQHHRGGEGQEAAPAPQGA